MKKILASLLTFNIFCFTSSFAQAATDSFSKVKVEEFFQQVGNAMNSRDEGSIRKYLNAYIHKNAQWDKKVIIIEPGTDSAQESIQEMNYNKEQYINSLLNLVKSKFTYHYTLEVNDITLSSDKNAIVSVAIEELIYDKGLSLSPDEDHEQKTTVTSNCNYSISQNGQSYIINNANCIEKVVLN